MYNVAHNIGVITNSILVYLRLDSGRRFHLLALTASLLETRPTCQRDEGRQVAVDLK